MMTESSPSSETQIENPFGRVDGAATQTAPGSAHAPLLVPPLHSNAASAQVTILGTTAWVGAHAAPIGATGPTVARQGPPSHSTAAIASFVVQPPSQSLGGSNGTPASPAS